MKNTEAEIQHTDTKEEAHKPQRIHFFDELRGFAIIAMVFYHGFVSVGYIFHIPWGTALVDFFYPVQPLFAAVFIVLSGISSMLSRNNYSRGFKLMLISLVVTAVTIFVTPGMEILFGILHFLSICMLLFGICKKFIVKIPVQLGFWLCVVLFILTYNIPLGYFEFEPYFSIKLPSVLYSTSFLFPLGFPSSSFYSSDYFPLIPWFFLFIAGGFLGANVKKGKVPKFMYKKHVPFLALVGRWSLWIYIAHQPVIFGILTVVQWLSN